MDVQKNLKPVRDPDTITVKNQEHAAPRVSTDNQEFVKSKLWMLCFN